MARLFTLSLLAGSLLCPAQEKWTPLFDGKSLQGWKQCNGKATFRVEQGEIVGTTAAGSPNSFLCTTKDFGDFVLEFEVKVDPVLNSGVQVRSHQYAQDTTSRVFNGQTYRDAKHPAGRVYGYQVEISNEKAGTSGGIYDEARRGWLENIVNDPAASKALRDNEWNKYRIEAEGDSIRVFVNGVACANLTDPLDQTGFIALQVHSFQGEKPAQVRWRNLRIQDRGKHEWRPLWDGKTLSGWYQQGGGVFTVEDGAIHARSKDEDARIGFLVSEAAFADVTARIQFKIAKGNSGFFLRAEKGTLAGYEVELDAESRTGGFWETGANGRKWVTGPEDNAVVKKDEWNEMTASLHGDKIVFHVNGVKTMHLPNDTAGRKDGHLALQAHGAKRPTEVWFKGIEVLRKAR
jgi:hypothetical protein